MGNEIIYILGCGAIGLTLSAYLAHEGRKVIAVRTGKGDVFPGKMTVKVHGPDADLKVSVETVSLSKLAPAHGIAVVTAKSYANKMIAAVLAEKGFSGPVVILQNGLGVEDPFIESPSAGIYRCVLYTTAQQISENEVKFRPVASCPVGSVKGAGAELEKCVNLLTTHDFLFHPEGNISREVWKKVIINSVFNSICPLLEVDNGIFIRDNEVAKWAEAIVGECVMLAKAKGVPLRESELMEQILRISKGSAGVLISTLQDIRNGRETEIESLNLAMARMAASIEPKIDLTRTELLGKMVWAKAKYQRTKNV